jgi:hypothetical protein
LQISLKLRERQHDSMAPSYKDPSPTWDIRLTDHTDEPHNANRLTAHRTHTLYRSGTVERSPVRALYK